MSEQLTFVQLVSTIQSANQTLVLQAKVAVNTSLTLRNWLIGYFIDEYELRGSDRADYGEGLLKALAKSLQQTQLSGVGRRQLYSYLTFYRVYPQIVRTASALLPQETLALNPLFEKVRTLSAKSFSGQPNLLKLFFLQPF